MGDYQNPSTTVLQAESDDIGAIQETVVQDSLTGNENPYSSVLLHYLCCFITSTAKSYDIDRIQVGVGLLLLFLLGFFCVCIAIAWKYYSPVIINFTIREQQERVYRRGEKGRQKKETKID